MIADGTLLLSRGEVERLLGIPVCIDAVENVFRLQGEGKVPASEILAVKTAHGGLHVKAGLLPGAKSYIVAKLNSNFPGNRAAITGQVICGSNSRARNCAVIWSLRFGAPLELGAWS
jgi:ornithine cyclodeaminase/alanine dehydrogenase-like protein (mu-crystallin family)